MRHIRRPTRVLAALLLAAVATSACGSGARDDASMQTDEGVAAPADPPDAGAEGAVDTGGQAGGIDTRDIIYTGDITVRVEDVDRAADLVTALAETYGGFVGGDRRSMDRDDARATMVLRIPSDSFTAAVDALGALGDEQTRDIDTEDVTEEVVDLETRIATAQASVDRTRELLERADSISEIVSVEEELTEREGRLASLQARQRELADLTALSTITATLVAEHAPVQESEPTEWGFGTGLDAGWRAFTATMVLLVTVFGALLPWLAAAAAPTAGAVWWARRRRAVSTTVPPPA